MNLIHFIKDYIRIKGWRDKKKAKLVFDNSKLSNLTEKRNSSRQLAPNIIENNPIDASGLALPTEFFGAYSEKPTLSNLSKCEHKTRYYTWRFKYKVIPQKRSYSGYNMQPNRVHLWGQHFT